MKILADENIALVEEAFAGFGVLQTVPGRQITTHMVRDVDALLVRSVTRVDDALLEGSTCRFVGTATSGTDHIDLDCLARRGITFADAHGCNADSVVDYVLSALAALTLASGEDWRKRSVGILGCGAVGSRLVRRLLALGIQPLVHDPFLDDSHALAGCLTTLHEVLGQDIVSLHVPLTRDGPWPTVGLLDETALKQLRPDATLINTARGEVVDNKALLAMLEADPRLCVVQDAWEGEPDINAELYARVRLGTPHIAGYSARGKLLGTSMIQAAFCKAFSMHPDHNLFRLDSYNLTLPAVDFNNDPDGFAHCLLGAYDIREDHQGLRESVFTAQRSRQFDAMRRDYPLRREFGQYQLPAAGLSHELEQALKAAGFGSLEG